MVHQHLPHHPRRQAEELGPIAPVDLRLVHKPQIGLVHEGGGLEAVIRPLATQIRRGQSAKLVVDVREQRRWRGAVTSGEVLEDRRGVCGWVVATQG